MKKIVKTDIFLPEYDTEIAIAQGDNKWFFIIRFLGENSEIVHLHGQREYREYEDAIEDAADVLDILGFEPKKPIDIEVVNNKQEIFYVVYDGETIMRKEAYDSKVSLSDMMTTTKAISQAPKLPSKKKVVRKKKK